MVVCCKGRLMGWMCGEKGGRVGFGFRGGFEGRLLRWRGYDGDGILRRMELIPWAQYSVPLSLWLPYLVICMRHVRSQALNDFFPLISELA